MKCASLLAPSIRPEIPSEQPIEYTEGGIEEAVSKPDIANIIRFAGSAGVSPARAYEKPHLPKETNVNKQHVISETFGHRDGGAPSKPMGIYSSTGFETVSELPHSEGASGAVDKNYAALAGQAEHRSGYPSA